MDIPEVRVRGLAYRAHHPRWAWSPESGEGARLHGGRFNPRGTPALYLSLSFETAWAEAQQAFPFKPQPLTLCAYEVDCDRIVDLTSHGLRIPGVPMVDLQCPWEALLDQGQEPPTHRLARDLIDRGTAGYSATIILAG